MSESYEKWYRIETAAGARHCMADGEELIVVEGSPFETWRRTDQRVKLSTARLLPPVIPSTFYAIGSNYRDHIEKMAAAAKRAPIYYERPRVGYRANSALIGDRDAIIKPADAGSEFQYEAELVAVIGRKIRNVTPAQAREAIFGWTIGNDVSERGWQVSDQTNIRAKNCDTFKPMGPCIARLPDLSGMRTRVTLNGVLLHDFDTTDMLFDAGEVIAEICRYNTMLPGDVVWLGTDDKPHNMKPGDKLEIEITGIGVLANHVAAG
jgi:2-keto-4-pentenoate hydratase/2-oxohepta-3-ene-1,7-dioic acid hydratase in catechol pathway